MNIRAIALATILGLSAPTITEFIIKTPVVAQARVPLGTFQGGEWSVTINYSNNALTYYGTNQRTGDNLVLRGAKVRGNPQRRLYIWNNGDYQYQVAWRPNDPRIIRLQVFNPAGEEILNRLLYEN